MCFSTVAFDIDPFQCSILYQKEGHFINDTIILCLR